MAAIKDSIIKLSRTIKEGDLSLEEEKIAIKMVTLLKSQLTSIRTHRIQYPKLKEYYLQYTQNCICCDSFHVRWFWMSDTRLGYLQANPCSPISDEIKHKKRADKIYSCPLCREVLMEKSIEELVGRLIESYISRRKIK